MLQLGTSYCLHHLKLKKAGWKAVVKKKRPMLSRNHRKERMDFAISHKEWTCYTHLPQIWEKPIRASRLQVSH